MAHTTEPGTRLNVRVRPNVICTRLKAVDGAEQDVSLPDWKIRSRLAYWEILELTRECPLRWLMQWRQKEHLTAHQRIELEKYLDPGPRVRHLWPDPTANGFEPFPPTNVTQAFYLQPSTNGVVEETTVPKLSADTTSNEVAVTREEVSSNLEPSSVHQDHEGPFEEIDEQAVVVGAPPGMSQIVLAPPGTGKTHVLVKRLRELIEQDYVSNPSMEVLILSFSRAAVAEITRRMSAEVGGGAPDDLRYVQVRTFDSYATRMLTRGNTGGLSLESGYQRRISQFRACLQKNKLPEAAQEEISGLRFLIVDEVQDLVGDRARMTLQMIRTVKAQGGTVLLMGDPAQAIYDWQLAEDDHMTSSEFLQMARSSLGEPADRFSELELSNYRRFQTKELLGLVKRARLAVGSDGNQPDITALTNQLASLATVPLNHLQEAQDPIESIAVLTRTNLEAFQISNWCSANSVPHRVERGSSGRYWPGWIARLCFGYRMQRMTLETAVQRWSDRVKNHEWSSFEQAKGYLRLHGLFSGDVLDMRELSELIERSQPQCLWPPDSALGISISTIHRSKGLEFDRVLLLKRRADGFNAGDVDEELGEARLLYVAATRARRHLSMLMRDGAVLKNGNKHCVGFRSSKLNHFHIYDRKNNYLLLDGLDELELGGFASAASAQVIGECQDEIWELFVGGAGTLSASRVGGTLLYRLPSGRHLCPLSRELTESLIRLGRTYRGNAGAVQAVSNIPVVDVASISFAWEGGSSVENRLGKARLALIPVVYGMSRIELTE